MNVAFDCEFLIIHGCSAIVNVTKHAAAAAVATVRPEKVAKFGKMAQNVDTFGNSSNFCIKLPSLSTHDSENDFVMTKKVAQKVRYRPIWSHCCGPKMDYSIVSEAG